MPSNRLQVRVDGPVGTLILDRPDRRNALDRKLIADLSEALQDLHGERLVKAVVLTGAGEVFCAGTDLLELHETLEASSAFETWHQDSQALLELIESMLRFPKPIIAAPNGSVMGTGVALVAAADFTIASESAKLQLPESRLGLSAGPTTPLLGFRIGTARTSQLLMSGEAIEAETARQFGLYRELVSPDLLWARCFEIAQQCARGARESHQSMKQMLNETMGEQLFTQLAIGTANLAAARTTDAAREGIRAFVEKRDPDWEQLMTGQ